MLEGKKETGKLGKEKGVEGGSETSTSKKTIRTQKEEERKGWKEGKGMA